MVQNMPVPPVLMDAPGQTSINRLPVEHSFWEQAILIKGRIPYIFKNLMW